MNKSNSIFYTILIILILPSVFTSDDQYYTEECYFINQLRNKVPKYKCCNGGYVKCSGDHIIEIEYYDYDEKNITMPNVISLMPYLEKLYLHLSSNDRSLILPRFYGLDSLQYLYINGNSFTGNIPPSIGELPKLEYLYITSTRLNGTFPTEIGQLINLKEIHFHHNMEFDGPLPSSIGKLTNLKILDMFCNSIGGSLPSSIGNLMNLEDLYLWRNKFTGRIPSSINNLTKVESIMLAENYFIDSIPAFNENLKNLKYLNLDQNNISGSIPSSISNLRNLESLKCSNNSLSGIIPSSIGNLSKLSSLKLNNNNLEGPLPSSLGDLINLEYLYLQNNKLNDTIPASIGKLMNLRVLYLNDNNFSNILPYREIEELTALEYLNLGNNNKLYGKVPDIFYFSNINKYNFNGTSLCYSENNITPINLYPGINYNCTVCIDNASINNDICECNENYEGIGYIKCNNINENDLSCISSNSNNCTNKQSEIITKSTNSYKYRVGQRDLTFIIKIRDNKIVKALGYLGHFYNQSIILKAAKILTDKNSILYDTFSIIGFKHVCFEIENDGVSDVYEYTEYSDMLGVFKWPNAKVFTDPDMFFNYNEIDWDSLSNYQGSTSISSAELNKMIDRDNKFPTEEFQLKHIFSNGKNQHYDFLRNNCHDFVKHCLELVGHPDTSKVITFKPDPKYIARQITQHYVENMTEEYVIDLFNSLKNKSCDPNVSSNSKLNNTINYTNGYKDDSEDCTSLIDNSALNIPDNSTIIDNSKPNNNTIPDDNHNSSTDSNNGKPKDEDSGFEIIKYLPLRSSFITLMLISILHLFI